MHDRRASATTAVPLLVFICLACGARAEVTYTVRRGDSVWAIAKQNQVSPGAVLAANNLNAESVIRPGDKLVIPDATSTAPAADRRGEAAEAIHVVRPGECLWAVARRYGTTVSALSARNGLSDDAVIRAGQGLVVPTGSAEGSGRPRDTLPGEHGQCFYVVAKGDNLSRIARRFGTSVTALAEINGLDPQGVLPVGLCLQLCAAGGDLPPVPDQQAGRELVQTAMKYRGVRYRYGGMTTRGMDCSGLVVRVLGIHGIDAPHNSKALYQLGEPVARDDLRPGDLVFFHTTRPGISHVGIYIGNNEFIHASSGRGRVMVSPLDEGYYHERYIGARRLT